MVKRGDVTRLAFVNLLIAVSGVVATSQIALVFGANRTMDGWFIAVSLTSGILSLIQTGQLSELLLPEYIRIKHLHGPQKAFEAYCVVLNWALLAACVFVGLGFVIGRPIIFYAARGFDPSQRLSILDLFQSLLPLVPLQIAGAFQQMLGNAEKKYGRFEVGALCGSIAGIMVVAMLHRLIGVWALVASQWVQQLTTLAYRHVQLSREGLSYRVVWVAEHFAIWQLVRQLGQTSAYVVSTQVYSVTLRALLCTLPGGVLSAYSYAETLYTRSSSLFLRPVGTVFFTTISTALVVSPGEVLANVKASLSRYLEMYFLVLAVALPATGHVLLALWGSPRYGPELVSLTKSIFLMFLVTLVFLMHSTMTRKMNLALGEGTRQYFLLSVVQALFACLVVVLVGQFGIWGGAVTVALNAVAASLIGWLVLRRARPELAIGFNRGEFLVHLAALVPAVLAGAGLAWQMGSGIDPAWSGWHLKSAHGLTAAASSGMCLLLYKLFHRWMVTSCDQRAG
jgi:peptidoglycan biosynthesis protein MviN/MurJ (putative lipid II flippase)